MKDGRTGPSLSTAWVLTPNISFGQREAINCAEEELRMHRKFAILAITGVCNLKYFCTGVPK